MTLMTDVERCVALTNHLASAETVTLRVREEEPGVPSSVLRAGPGGVLIAGDEAAAAAGIEFVRQHAGGMPQATGGGGGGAAAAAAGNGGEAAQRDGSGSAGVSGASSEEEGEPEAAGAAGGALSIQERRRLRRAAASAAKGRKLWRDVTVRVDPRLQPVYILGRALRRKDMRRGLASCASAEALKLGAREPERLAASLSMERAVGVASEEAGGGGDGASDAAASAPGTPRSGAGSQGPARSSSLASASSLLSGVLGGGDDESDAGGAAAADGGAPAADDDGPRLAVTLPDEWRQEIADKVLSRLDMIAERVTVLAIAEGVPPSGGA
jgi:hypothetical protein